MQPFAYLPNIVLLLTTAIFIVVIFRKLNLSPVLGYLVAGAAIGQHGFAYVSSEDLHAFAEFGVVFLLFAIGLELTIERLMAMRWHVFGFGTAQVLITTAIIATMIYAMDFSIELAIIVGGGLALSSTAIVLRVISEDHAYNTQVGRLALANLLLQDFAVVPLLVLVPLLASDHNDIWLTLGNATGKAFLVMIAIFFVGRLLLRPLFKLIVASQSNELFTAVTLLIVLGSSLITESLGLSLAMGAFIAGLLVAETEYHQMVEENIMPFKDLLLGLFFMSVGMSIDMGLIHDQWLVILGLTLALILGKATIIMGLCRIFGFPLGSSIHSGLLLAQGGEFAFVLFGLASQESIGLLPQSQAQILLLVVTISMALTPVLSHIGKYFSQLVDTHSEDFDPISLKDITDLCGHVIIVGYNATSEMVAKLLEVKRISYIILEPNGRKIKEGIHKGYPIFKGDASKSEDLDSLSAEHAKAIIVTVEETLLMKKIIRSINKQYPNIPIVVRSEDLRSAQTLTKIGATSIVPERYESGLQLAGQLLKAVGISDIEISKLKNQFRAGNYELTKDII